MASSWSTKRRFIFGGVFVVFIALLAGLLFLKIIYKAPTCSDGYKNGDETGVDCGGGCKNLCTSDTLNPVVLWAKVFNISGDVYSVVAYIENPNLNSKNIGASYQFSIFDSSGNLITVKDGKTTIPKGKKFAVFETGIVLKGSKPRSADFKFIKFGPWEKDTTKEPDLAVRYSTLTSTTTVPRITGTISNDSLQSIPGLELAVFVLDGNENVVAASNTFVDNLAKRSSQDFVFTWPKPFNLGVEACISPVDIDLELDRSGSMRSEGDNPSEPFTTVLITAKEFIKNLKKDDQVSVGLFGFNPEQISPLSFNKQNAINAIDKVTLPANDPTYIRGGLLSAYNTLMAAPARPDSKKVVILLTDGIPTEPQEETIAAADQLKSSGITLYTIGLGKSVNEDLLKKISTDEAHYFLAPTKDTLSAIYTKINSNLCQKKPNVINVIYRPTN